LFWFFLLSLSTSCIFALSFFLCLMADPTPLSWRLMLYVRSYGERENTFEAVRQCVCPSCFLSSSPPAYPSPAPSHDLPRPVLADAEAWPMHNRPMEPVQRDPPPNPHKFYLFHTSDTERTNLSSSLPYRAVRRLTNANPNPNPNAGHGDEGRDHR
jgi:hypothetical protein